MVTHEAFLSDIGSRPDEDAPRLIYADWLEEYGAQPDRAEFIRVQIELARRADEQAVDVESFRQRERELLRAAGLTWNTFPGYVRRWRFHRGFVHHIEVEGNDWIAHADDLLRRHPIREVELRSLPTLESSSSSL